MALSYRENIENNAIHAGKVHPGMKVTAQNGDVLGSVTEVWAYLPSYGYVRRTHFALGDYGPIRGTDHLFAGADGYVEVGTARALRREGEESLYVQLSEIWDLVPGEAVVLDSSTGDRAIA